MSMLSEDPYSAEVRRLFHAPEHAGALESGLRAGRRSRDVTIELGMQVEGARIAKLRFRALGCPHVIAAAEAFCAGWEARPVIDLAEFRAADLVQNLPVPVEKTGRILVLEDAVQALLQAANEHDPKSN